MAQPKRPPLSVRLPDGLIERLDVWAAEHDTTRNALVVEFIERGFRGDGEPAAPNPPPARKAAPAAKVAPEPRKTPAAPSVAAGVPVYVRAQRPNPKTKR